LSAICDTYSSIANTWEGNRPIHIGVNDGEYTDEYDISTSRYYSSAPVNDLPESVSDEKDTLIFGTSKSGALQYGIALSRAHKLCVCSADEASMEACYHSLFGNLTLYSDRKIVFIDGEKGAFQSMADNFPSCQYINSVEALDIFIENLKPELNTRLEHEAARSIRLFIVIAEFNKFFDMISDGQAAFMRKLLHYIDSPEYGICFICGFNADGEKSNDSLFVTLVVNAGNYLICRNTYDKALSKIETLPFIHGVSASNCYVCLDGKADEIRW
ncbi:MAG: hypothetical protein HFH14_10290, partial [Lachnospiraceae bacterium]|nr:hypothetical protein [Lachnospiraceae bacterium]